MILKTLSFFESFSSLKSICNYFSHLSKKNCTFFSELSGSKNKVFSKSSINEGKKYISKPPDGSPSSTAAYHRALGMRHKDGQPPEPHDCFVKRMNAAASLFGRLIGIKVGKKRSHRALSSLRGLRGAPEVPPLCRETSVSRTANVGTVGMNRHRQAFLGPGNKTKY